MVCEDCYREDGDNCEHEDDIAVLWAVSLAAEDHYGLGLNVVGKRFNAEQCGLLVKMSWRNIVVVRERFTLTD